MRNINYSNKVPYYQQLYEIMREKILNGDWKPGDMIPPESELIERFQISRTTVRQTLKLLVDDGLIYRQRGRGSFVANFTLNKGLNRIVSFNEDMKQRGFKPETKMIFSGHVKADKESAEKLHIALGTELVTLKRLRMADGEPLSLENSHFLGAYYPDITNNDLTRFSLKERLEADYNIKLTRAEQFIKAVEATEELALLLKIKKKSPLLYVERLSYSEKNEPVEFLRIYYRGDRYSLFYELRG